LIQIKEDCLSYNIKIPELEQLDVKMAEAQDWAARCRDVIHNPTADECVAIDKIKSFLEEGRKVGVVTKELEDFEEKIRPTMEWLERSKKFISSFESN
jgi:hypothetical protein